jgi:outer membrane protein TolC
MKYLEGNQREFLPSRAGVVAAALLLSGCATFSNDGGFEAVQRIVKDNTGKDVVIARTSGDRQTLAVRVAELLQKPLGVEEAVEVALLNNRGLQASFGELGIAEADLVQAGRLPNPHFTFARSRFRPGGATSIEQALSFNIFSLVTMPLATEVEKRRFARAQGQAALEVLRLASETRKAYFVAVAAEESVRYMRQVRTAAEASAELARRMEQVGNWSKLSRMREQGFYADAALQVARAEKSAVSAREQLIRSLGLSGKEIEFKLPERLPALPQAADELPGVEGLAMERRLDLRMVRQDAETQARNLGLTRTTRFINVLELGVAREREKASDGDVETKTGYEISFELPIFDFGTTRLARAEAVYAQVLDRAAEAAVNARSEVREAYTGYRTSYDIARHYRDEIVPLRKRIADENLLRYNGMLIGVFELLADARSQILSVNSAIEALRDFWIARADLDMALIGKPSISRAQGASGSQAEAPGGH